MKTAFALIPPGAVIAVQVERLAALVGLASELKIPGLPVALLGKLSAIAYATYPGDQTVLVFEAESPEALDLMQPLVQVAAKKQYTARMGNRMVIAPNAAFVRPGLDALAALPRREKGRISRFGGVGLPQHGGAEPVSAGT